MCGRALLPVVGLSVATETTTASMSVRPVITSECEGTNTANDYSGVVCKKRGCDKVGTIWCTLSYIMGIVLQPSRVIFYT